MRAYNGGKGHTDLVSERVADIGMEMMLERTACWSVDVAVQM
jgi:hypothetical protein